MMYLVCGIVVVTCGQVERADRGNAETSLAKTFARPVFVVRTCYSHVFHVQVAAGGIGMHGGDGANSHDEMTGLKFKVVEAQASTSLLVVLLDLDVSSS